MLPGERTDGSAPASSLTNVDDGDHQRSYLDVEKRKGRI
jgi:hypothetical protein